MMTREGIAKSRESIEVAKSALEDGLLQPEDASQLYRMIGYEEERIAASEAILDARGE